MKILIVCESTYKFESGGRVVRFLAKILKSKDQDFRILVLDQKRDDYDLDSFYLENKIIFFPLKKNLKYRLAKLLVRTNELNRFRDIIENYAPDVVHFASFDNNKPAKFITESRKTARVVLQPWTMQFYCAQGFGFRSGHKCELCLKGHYWNAIAHKCVPLKGIPLQVERSYLHQKAISGTAFLSSNSELDLLLTEYGIKKDDIFRFPVPFDCSFTDAAEEVDGDYFSFYGQANEHKGLKVLLKVFEALPNQRLKIYPLSKLDMNLSYAKNIEVIYGKNWSNGLKEEIINSKAVLIPSLWATSTEYSMCEALLLKKPIVVFNVGVHKDIFKHKFNAMVIAPNDVDEYAKAIIELDKDPALRKSIAQNGFDTLVHVNDPERIYKALITAYTSKQ